MKIDLATAFVDRALASEVAELLRGGGHEITREWWHEDPVRFAADPAYREDMAESDYHGVREADVMVFLNHPEARGALVKLGLAIGQGKTTLVVRPERQYNVFFSLPEVVLVPDVCDVLAALRGLVS